MASALVRCGADCGARMTRSSLGNVAFRAGKKIEWDAKNLRISNAPEAEKFLGQEYRDGWSLS